MSSYVLAIAAILSVGWLISRNSIISTKSLNENKFVVNEKQIVLQKEFNQIKIDNVQNSVVFKGGREYRVYYQGNTKIKPDFAVDKQKLIIKNQHKFIFNYHPQNDSVIIIEMPKHKLKSASIETTNGNIIADYLVAEHGHLNSANGDIRINDLKTERGLSITSANGDAIVKRTNATGYDLYTLPFLIGAILMFQGQIGAGTLVMIVQLSNEFINQIVNIFQQLNEIKSTKPMWDKVQAAIDFQESAPERNNKSFTGLELKNISYKQKDKTIISDLNFELKLHEKVLLMAPSGWGKRTLLNLILGQNEPAAGEILINQQSVTADQHQFFSYVNQKPFIFDDSLKFNILLGRSVDSKLLDQVIETAGLTELIQDKSWDYQVGEKGSNLSGGQIQRIEIARALLADRPVLLADEATSALDSQLSLKIHQAILKNPNVAVIEVAHKISDEEKTMFNRIVELS